MLETKADHTAAYMEESSTAGSSPVAVRILDSIDFCLATFISQSKSVDWGDVGRATDGLDFLLPNFYELAEI